MGIVLNLFYFNIIYDIMLLLTKILKVIKFLQDKRYQFCEANLHNCKNGGISDCILC